ncbi:MAG TPA: ComF family protein [Steroidobacteraceae bacterium]|nr:ComF family protein [Steroidobacteraceae bacterium]
MFDSGVSIVNRLRGVQLTAVRGLSRLLGATLFPPNCCLCGFPGTEPDLDLCLYCRDDLPWDLAQLPSLLTALRFEPPVDGLVRRLKYSGALEHARVLGELLAQTVRARGDSLPRLLVPVPLHPARLRERGFNQAAGIARYTGRSLGIPQAWHAARRVRDTPSQTTLGIDERHANVRGAFAISSQRALRQLLDAQHVAIVDDVTTTGSTLAELKCVLLAAGVRRVDLWAVARAPRTLASARDTPAISQMPR